MRVVQFFRKQIGNNAKQNICLGIQLPANNAGSKVDSGDIVEVPKSYLGLSDEKTSIDLLSKWDQIKGHLQRYK